MSENQINEIQEALEEIEGLLYQALNISDPEEVVDSRYISAYASALKFLAKHNRFIIYEERGRYVRGKFNTK